MVEEPTQSIDQHAVEEFAGKMLGFLNGGFLAMMTSIGHQTGLFDAMARLGAATSQEIAGAATLNERYVREWLGAMVMGQIVAYDPDNRRYRLPPEHAAVVTEAAGSRNVATLTQFVSCMGEVEPGIVECFRKGGGLPYQYYKRFHRVMRAVSGQRFEEALIKQTLPLVPGCIDRLQKGMDVLDVGCGSGHAANLMAREYPDSRFAGYDFSDEAIGNAWSEAREWGLNNVRFELKDVSSFEDIDAYDLITAFDVVHDQARPRDLLRCVARGLRDHGTFLMVDIDMSSDLEKNYDRPLGPYVYSISAMHCMSVSLALDGEGLGTAWGEEQARELLKEAGFEKVDVHRIEGDIVNAYYVATK